MTADGAGKIVKVDADEIHGGNTHFFHGLELFRQILVAQNAAVNHGVQGFDASSENFGETGDVTHSLYRKAAFFETFHGAAGGDEFHAIIDEEFREFDETGFVRDAEYRSVNGKQIHAKTPSGMRGSV